MERFTSLTTSISKLEITSSVMHCQRLSMQHQHFSPHIVQLTLSNLPMYALTDNLCTWKCSKTPSTHSLQHPLAHNHYSTP